MTPLALLAALAAALAAAGVTRSGATFVAGSASPANGFAAAADFNTVSVALADPGTPLRGTVTLTATASSDRGIASVRFQWALAGTGIWMDACATVTSSPYTCSFATTGVPDGTIDLRALATDTAGYTRTSAVSARSVDNTAPVLALTDPGSLLQGTVALSGTAFDSGSGLASVRLQYAPAGTSGWTDICAAASCSWSTTALPDALYDVRLLATDAAGNQATAVRASLRVDNDGPTVTVTDPGSPLRGVVSVSAGASDPAGVASVAFQLRDQADASGTWKVACSDTAAPYACPVDTRTVPDGLYDLRAVATDILGHAKASAIVAARRVDNTAPTGVDVMGANGGTAGKLDAGDTITFTASEAVSPASVLSGWSGAATPISVVVANSGSNDLLTLTGGTINLIAGGQSLQTQADWVSGTVTFPGTMTQSGTKIVVTLGTLSSSRLRAGVTTSARMTWPLSTAATDLAGNPFAAGTVTQSTAKVNF